MSFNQYFISKATITETCLTRSKRCWQRNTRTKFSPQGLRSWIQAVQRFGNFSAHPITDLTSLQVIDVDPEEAEWCLQIIYALFDHYYVGPALNAKKLGDLDQKLLRAGIKPIGPQANNVTAAI